MYKLHLCDNNLNEAIYLSPHLSLKKSICGFLSHFSLYVIKGICSFHLAQTEAEE